MVMTFLSARYIWNFLMKNRKSSSLNATIVHSSLRCMGTVLMKIITNAARLLNTMYSKPIVTSVVIHSLYKGVARIIKKIEFPHNYEYCIGI